MVGGWRVCGADGRLRACCVDTGKWVLREIGSGTPISWLLLVGSGDIVGLGGLPETLMAMRDREMNETLNTERVAVFKTPPHAFFSSSLLEVSKPCVCIECTGGGKKHQVRWWVACWVFRCITAVFPR